MKESYNFLISLKLNNNREWFNQHRNQYEIAHNEAILFANNLLDEMNAHDHLATVSGKKSLFRIYRDVRFSSNKSPYKTSWNGTLKRATEELRGGYYYHIEPENTFIAGGFFGPNAQDLLHIRKQIELDSAPLRKSLVQKTLKISLVNSVVKKSKPPQKDFRKIIRT